MLVVNFHLNEIQEKELDQLMKREGFTSRAEFFRFLMKFYKYHQPANEQLPSSSPAFMQAPPLSFTSEEITPKISTTIDDSNLSPEKQKLLNNPHIFDEEVRQFIRDMEE